MFITSILALIINAFTFIIAFDIFGFEISFIEALFLGAILNFGLLISITPAGFGITESLTIFSALTIGITPVQSLSVAVIRRITRMLILFILGPIFSYLLIKRKPDKKEKI